MKLNRLQIAGNICNDLTLQSVGTNKTPLCKVSMAVQVNDKFDPTFIDCDVWSKKAEVLIQYAKKGDNIFFEGELRTASWMDKKTNTKRTKLTLNVSEFQLMGQKPKNEEPVGKHMFSSNEEF